MNTSKSLDYFGNNKKAYWDDLDHILAYRHHIRKSEVKKQILAWHKAELAKERAAIVEAVEGLAPKKRFVPKYTPQDKFPKGYNAAVDDFLEAIKEWQ